MFSRELEVGGRVVEIDQEPAGDTGVVVWDAALVLAKYLEMKPALVKDKRVVELGSGTGAVGLAAAALGGSVMLTDLEENLNLLKHNVNKNQDLRLNVEAAVLEWGDSDMIKDLLARMKIDVVLVADCVYYEESLDSLVRTMSELSGPQTNVLVSYEDRDSEEKIRLQKKFSDLMKAEFTCEEVEADQQHPDYTAPDIHILVYRKKELLAY